MPGNEPLQRILGALILIVVLSGCNLPISATPAAVSPVPSDMPLETPIVIIPQFTPTAVQIVPTHTVQPDQPTRIPTEIPSATPTLAPITVSTIPAGKNGPFAVILVAPNDVLNIRQTNNPNSPMVDSLPYNATNIVGTGNEITSNGIRWVEIYRPNGDPGWVNARYLTEYVAAPTFCSDPQVETLVSQVRSALVEKNGQMWAALISPYHGFNLQYLRGGTAVNYDREKTAWLFDSTYEMTWGIHPGSGMSVKGNFAAEVYPKLMDVFDADSIQACAEIRVGGTTYTPSWPQEYENINYLSLHRPGPPGDDLNWRTWLVGVEYVGGKPYLIALNHLFWEP